MFPCPPRPIFIRDSDGGTVPFDPAALKTRLAGAFIAAGLPDESFVSEEMVTALLFVLQSAPGEKLIFSSGEIDAAMIRQLESSGYPEAAHIFRSTASEQQLLLSVSPENLSGFLAAHLACSPERLARIAGRCAESLNILKITSASPHLLIELARHYEREFAENDLRESAAFTRQNGKNVLTSREIFRMLDDDAAELFTAGVLFIGGISPVFPGIRFTFHINKFADLRGLSSTLSELELFPELYGVSGILERARAMIQQEMATGKLLPYILHIPDMSEFLAARLGCIKADKMAIEIAGILGSELKSELYQLSFD